MAQHLQPAFTILRRTQVEAESGYSRSTIYLRITQGLFPKPVRLGSRAVGWPAREIAAINEARIAGESDASLRELVQKLLRARGEAPPSPAHPRS
jgi:prophage regulatory protein